MSRTFRNRHSTPWGYVVWDGQELSLKDGTRVPPWDRWCAPPGARWVRIRRSIFRTEKAGPRRQFNRDYRTRTNHLVRIGRWEEVMPPRRTGGWLSW